MPLPPRQMLKYQVGLLEQDDVTLKTTSIFNLAQFLSVQKTGVTEHDYLQIIKEV